MRQPVDEPCDVLLAYPRERMHVFESMIPLGLASVGAVLEQRGYRVRIVDFAFYARDFRRDLRRWNPRAVGIGGTTATRAGSFLTACLVKEVMPHVPVVYGGVHASFAAEDTLSNVPQIDYVVCGEGEFAFAGLCDRLIRGEGPDPSETAGVSLRSETGYVHNKPQRIDDLDALPLPARHLFGDHYRMTLDFLGTPAEFLMTSRGCPAGCSFCAASRMFPGGVRLRSMAHVQQEVEQVLAHRRVGALKLFDSTFTANRAHVIAFCDMIRPYHLLWECEIRADTVDQDLLELMRDAGCRYVNVGLETTSARLLTSIGKGISVPQVERVLDWCTRLAVKTKVFFTFGHLGQTMQECRDDLRYIRSRRDSIDFFATTVGMRVYPGTALAARATSAGLMPTQFSWARYRPSLRNRLLFEFGDVFVLRQPGLSTAQLFLIILTLLRQRTVVSADFVRKLALLNVLRMGQSLLMRARFFGHVVRRRFEAVA